MEVLGEIGDPNLELGLMGSYRSGPWVITGQLLAME